MIDPRRAMGLLKALRFAKENLKDSLKDDNAHWHDTPYHSEDATAYDSFEAEYGLPEGIDLGIPPEVAFPPPSVILREERSDESKDPYSPAHRVGEMGAPSLSHSDRVGDVAGNTVGAPPLSRFGDRVGADGCPIPTSLDRTPLFPDIPVPVVRDYTAAGIFIEATPEDMELNEILKEQGYKAMERRAREHQRDSDRKKQRQHFRANYERYAAEARAKNIQRAAEHLLKETLAAQKAAAANPQPVPPSADDTTGSAATKKPPLSTDKSSSAVAQELDQEAQSIA